MYQSLIRNCPGPLTLYALCFDNEAYTILGELELEDVVPISLEEFERGDNELLQAKKNRSKVEYYFTCTPSLLLFVFKTYTEVNKLTYLDADLYFFSSIKPIFDEMGDKSILIIPHRFSTSYHKDKIYGDYNVGLLIFNRNIQALSCLQWWRTHCIEWCFDYVEKEKFADQKYLNQWPALFENIHILKHIGANVAPWNIGNYKVSIQNRSIMVDNTPLVFFHFSGVRILSRFFVYPNFRFDNIVLNKEIKKIYTIYIGAILESTYILQNHAVMIIKNMEVFRLAIDRSLFYQFKMFLRQKTIFCFFNKGWFFDSASLYVLIKIIIRKFKLLIGNQ